MRFGLENQGTKLIWSERSNNRTAISDFSASPSRPWNQSIGMEYNLFDGKLHYPILRKFIRSMVMEAIIDVYLDGWKLVEGDYNTLD